MAVPVHFGPSASAEVYITVSLGVVLEVVVSVLEVVVSVLEVAVAVLESEVGEFELGVLTLLPEPNPELAAKLDLVTVVMYSVKMGTGVNSVVTEPCMPE